jgi:hypothetical protein
MLPIAGFWKGAIQTGTGKDLVTGEEVNRWWEAGGTLASVLTHP